MNSIIK